ncbi:MAG: SH3 domain-containing protein, partial [Anaerolineae bacterium]|nr:SH3 domain-containing protein [Anaerolineae bacterium]
MYRQHQIRKRIILGALLTIVLVALLSACAPKISLHPTPTPSPTPVIKLRPTFTPTPTPKPEPTDTPTPIPPTPTPSPTNTPTPLPPAAIPTTNMNVRKGPGTNYPIIGAARAGQVYLITGKNPRGDWWQIDYRGRAGWLYAPLT